MAELLLWYLASVFGISCAIAAWHFLTLLLAGRARDRHG